MNAIQIALANIETAWEEMKTVPIKMTIEEFEKRVLQKARAMEIKYSSEPGKWLDQAKKMLADPTIPQKLKNLALAEAQPKEQRTAHKKFTKSIATLIGLAEWTYQDLKSYVNDSSKDELLRAFLRWRLFLPAEAYHKFYRLKLRGRKTRNIYLKLRPTVIFRRK